MPEQRPIIMAGGNTPGFRMMPAGDTIPADVLPASLAGYRNGGLLSFATDPENTADLVAQGTLRYLRRETDRILTCTGTAWVEQVLASDPTLALAGLTATSLYDAFVYNVPPATFGVRGSGLGTAGTAPGGTFAVNFPASVAGDTLLVFLSIDTAGAPVAPAGGWVQVGTTQGDGAGNSSFTVWRKTSAGETSATWTGVSGTCRAVAHAVQGAAIDVFASSFGSGLTSLAQGPSVTTTAAPTILFTGVLASTGANVTFTPAAGQTATLAGGGPGNSYPLLVGFESVASAGATGVRNVVASSAAYMPAHSVALKQGPGAGVYLELGPAWASNTARAAGGLLSRVQGRWVRASDPTRAFLGTLRAATATTGEDSFAVRGLFDYYADRRFGTSNANRLTFNGWGPTPAVPQTTNVQIFSTAGTTAWVNPPGARWVKVSLIAGGGGAGGGRVGLSTTIRCGGGGGGGGGVAVWEFPASALGATESVTVGAGGNGGAAVGTDSTNGNAGTAGGNSSFGSWLRATGGGGGGGGTVSTGTGGSAGAGFLGVNSQTNGGSGASASTTGGAGAVGAATNWSPAGGGSGGGSTAANVRSAGGAGGAIGGSGVGYAGTITGGVGRTPDTGTTGGAGTSLTAGSGVGGSGGGGGGSTATSLIGAGAGGAGGRGAGGGGGGAGTDSTSGGGAGGRGGDGEIVVISYF